MKTTTKRLTISLTLCTIAVGCALFILGNDRPAVSWAIVAAWAIIGTFTVIAIRKNRDE